MTSKIHLTLAGKSAETPIAFHAPSMRQTVYLESILDFLSPNLRWHGLTLSSREWGELLVAAWRKEYPIPGITGGVAFIGGNYRSLTHGQCSEVITIAEELLSRLGVSPDTPPERPVVLHQVGDCLADLAAIDELASRPGASPATGALQSTRSWGNVARRPRLPCIFETDEITHSTICDSEGENYDQ